MDQSLMSRQDRSTHFALCLATASLIGFHTNASTAQIVYAAPDGNDRAAGTATAPVASVNRAIELARSTSEHIVELRGVARMVRETIDRRHAEQWILSESQPSGEFVQPEQIGALAVFLCSASAARSIVLAERKARSILELQIR
jgi:hypothetical protein